jgi:hypothetical protein
MSLKLVYKTIEQYFTQIEEFRFNLLILPVGK